MANEGGGCHGGCHGGPVSIVTMLSIHQEGIPLQSIQITVRVTHVRIDDGSMAGRDGDWPRL